MPYSDKDKQAEYQREHYQNNKEIYNNRIRARRKELNNWFIELKSKLKCSRCEESHIACLDFHHKDKDTKLYNVSGMSRRYGSKRLIIEEIAKCEILCSNCHRKLHYEEEKSKITEKENP